MEVSGSKEVDKNEANNLVESALPSGNFTGDRAPYEIALSMDHILEKIFSSSKKKDILSFRFVSRQWNFCARKQLQKQVRMYLTSTEDLERFKCLLEDQSYLHSAFPASKFKFSNPCRNDQDKCFTRHISGCETSVSLGDALIQDILNLHGNQIRVLHLDLSHDCKDRSHYVHHSEMQFINDIKNLLLNQAPNLTLLKIKTDFRFRRDSIMYFNNSNNDILQPRNNEAAALSLKCKSADSNQVHNFKAFNRKLKVLHLQDTCRELSISQNILENILQLAPNVTQIIPSGFCDYSYYLHPRNILPYLQTIRIPQQNWVGTLTSVETLEQIADACEEEDVKFRGITLYSHRRYFRCLDSNIQERTVNVVNRILEWSWDTLETIEWDEFTFWPDLTFPPTMPKVWKISIFHPHDFPNKGQCLFPQNCRWSETFPNVRTVLIYSMAWKVRLLDFINSLTSEPVRSVTKLEIAGLMYSKAEKPSGEHLGRLKALFPCAHISY